MNEGNFFDKRINYKFRYALSLILPTISDITNFYVSRIHGTNFFQNPKERSYVKFFPLFVFFDFELKNII